MEVKEVLLGVNYRIFKKNVFKFLQNLAMAVNFNHFMM